MYPSECGAFFKSLSRRVTTTSYLCTLLRQVNGKLLDIGRMADARKSDGILKTVIKYLSNILYYLEQETNVGTKRVIC